MNSGNKVPKGQTSSQCKISSLSTQRKALNKWIDLCGLDESTTPKSQVSPRHGLGDEHEIGLDVAICVEGLGFQASGFRVGFKVYCQSLT